MHNRVFGGGGSRGEGAGVPEGQLLGRPLSGRLIAVIISACSEVGVLFWTSESGQFQSNFPCAGISLHHAKCTKKGELLAESLKPSPRADLIRETATNGVRSACFKLRKQSSDQ